MRWRSSSRTFDVVVTACVLLTLARAPLAWAEPELPLATPLTRIAFGSCLHQDHPQPIWAVVERFQPELVLLLGDNVYAKTEDMHRLAAAYVALGARPEFQAVRKKIPILSVWDDNDYGLPDSGAEFAQKERSKDLFLSFFNAPATDQRRNHRGIYGSWVFGPVGKRTQILLLDTRTFRGPLQKTPKQGLSLELHGPYTPHAPERKVPFLGEQQWRWLEREIQRPAELRLVVSSVQFLSDEHGYECWGNFPFERSRLLALLATSPQVPTLLLSGDRHHGEVSVARDLGRSIITEVTSSSLNLPRIPSPEPNRYRTAGPFFEANVGTIEISWDPALHVVVGFRGEALLAPPLFQLPVVFHEPTSER